MKLIILLICLILLLTGSGCARNPVTGKTKTVEIDKSAYADRIAGFWLGQSIANWTGLVTEMDKIGGEGPHGQFYTRHDWGKADQPSIWGQGLPSNLSATIDWVFENEGGWWDADDDTDIEYIYLHLLHKHGTTHLTPQQIRDGWLTHIYTDELTPFRTTDGKKENYLWVSNQRAFDLMLDGILPPATGAPANNPHFDMIDAQLTTEMFGLFAPYHPDIALDMAQLPILTTARENAKWAAEFYIIMHALAAHYDAKTICPDAIKQMATIARSHLPSDSYVAKMYDFVESQYNQGASWEEARDAVYRRYQVEQQDGYNLTSRALYCNGCFAAGINYAASIISLLYGEGDFKNTVKIATLAGWDADNPAATWGGLLGFIYGRDQLEYIFGRRFSDKFYIHRTRKGFEKAGMDTFTSMAQRGVKVTERVVTTLMGGTASAVKWQIPLENSAPDYPFISTCIQ